MGRMNLFIGAFYASIVVFSVVCLYAAIIKITEYLAASMLGSPPMMVFIGAGAMV